MGFFSRKREEKDEALELPPLRFPEAPDFRRMEGETETIKKAVTRPSFGPPMPRPMPPVTEERMHVESGKNVFVKVTNYKEAMKKMDYIKDKLLEAEKLLRELDEVRRKENEDMRIWHQDLQMIKQGLLSIDKTLFE